MSEFFGSIIALIVLAFLGGLMGHALLEIAEFGWNLIPD